MFVSRDQIEVVRTSGNDSWGNCFLTNTWRLYADMTRSQHDVAMERLGIDRHSVLVSGCINKHGVAFRSSPGEDRGEITNAEARQFMAVIREILSQSAGSSVLRVTNQIAAASLDRDG